MPSEDETGSVSYPPEPDTVIRVGWTLTLLGIVIFIVSALGEYLGWWNLIGEIGMLAGTVLSIVVGFGTWVYGAGREQVAVVGSDVRGVGHDVKGVGREVAGVRRVVEDNGTKLDSVDGKLEKLDKLDKLDVIEDALVAEDGETSRLDVVQVELDRQTGVLDRQLSVLGEIRDAI